MCEQCTAQATTEKWLSYHQAIGECPRLKSLGEPTVAWLKQVMDYEVEDALEEERHNAQLDANSTAGIRSLSRRVQVVLIIVALAAISITIIGAIKAHLLWGWSRATPTDILLAGILLLVTVVALFAVMPLPSRARQVSRRSIS